MEDIAPELLEKISAAFFSNIENSRALSLLGKIKSGKCSYIDAAEYAEEIGTALANAFGTNLSSAVLPDGKMYQNIAEKIIRPLMEQDYSMVSDAAVQVQQALNQAADIGLKAQSAPLNTDRIEGIVNRVSGASDFDSVAWILDEPIKTFSRSVVDDTLKKNVEFQGKAGLTPKIIRKAESKCCKWCSALAGAYRYPDTPNDIYRRHERCRCTVEYDPGSGKRQNVWSKQWSNSNEKEVKRIELPQKSGPENVLTEYLRNAEPGKGKINYENGYDISLHKDEIKTAQWIHTNLGGDISLLEEINLDGQKTPDYLWNGKLWELKNISSEKSADSAMRGALKQIIENPGGVILNHEGDKLSLNKLNSVISARVNRSCQFNVDVLVVEKNNLVSAFRYKK